MFVAFFCTLETNKSNASQCVFNQAWSFKDFSIAFNSAHSAVYFILSHQILEKSYFLYYSEFRCLTCYMACLKIYEKKSFTYLKSFILFGVTWELSINVLGKKSPKSFKDLYIVYQLYTSCHLFCSLSASIFFFFASSLHHHHLFCHTLSLLDLPFSYFLLIPCCMRFFKQSQISHKWLS